jgi:hypothetical protein
MSASCPASGWLSQSWSHLVEDSLGRQATKRSQQLLVGRVPKNEAAQRPSQIASAVPRTVPPLKTAHEVEQLRVARQRRRRHTRRSASARHARDSAAPACCRSSSTWRAFSAALVNGKANQTSVEEVVPVVRPCRDLAASARCASRSRGRRPAAPRTRFAARQRCAVARRGKSGQRSRVGHQRASDRGVAAERRKQATRRRRPRIPTHSRGRRHRQPQAARPGLCHARLAYRAHLETSLQRPHPAFRFGLKPGKSLAGTRLDDVHALALLENPGVVARRIDLDLAVGTRRHRSRAAAGSPACARRRPSMLAVLSQTQGLDANQRQRVLAGANFERRTLIRTGRQQWQQQSAAAQSAFREHRQPPQGRRRQAGSRHQSSNRQRSHSPARSGTRVSPSA